MEKEELLIDTSSILFSFSNNKDIFEILSENKEYTLVISKGIIRELTKFSKSKKHIRKNAVMALYSIKKNRPIIEDSNIYVDDWILKKAVKNNIMVCTNDINLKKKLRKYHIKVLSVNNTGILR